MNPVELRELMNDAGMRGQYLAAIRHRGKDVLLGDIEKLIEIMIDEAVEIEERKTEIAILNQQLSAKTISEQNIIKAFGIKGEGEHSKLVIEYVSGLVAECESLKKDLMFWDNDDLEQPFDHPVEIASECEMPFGTEFTVQVASRMPKRTYRVTRAEEYEYEVEMVEGAEIETPVTDAFTAELRAQGIDKWIESRNGRWNGTTKEAEDFAANLRAGRKG